MHSPIQNMLQFPYGCHELPSCLGNLFSLARWSFGNQHIQIQKLRTYSLLPPSSLQIIEHHLQHAPLSVTPRAFHSNLKSHLFKLSFPDSPDSISSHSPPKLHLP